MFLQVIIPEQVREEVLFNNKPGSITINGAIQEGWIKVTPCNNNPVYGLGDGEEAAIHLARERREQFLTDDNAAIQVAKALNIPVIRTSSIIILAASKKLISKDEAVACIDAMIAAGQYMTTLDYGRIRKVLDELKK